MPKSPPFQLWAKPDAVNIAPAQWAHLIARELVYQPLASAMPVVLQLLGKWGEADRVYIIEYNASLTLFRNTHEWARRGVSSHVEDLQNAPVKLLGSLHKEAVAGHAVAVHDVHNMPLDCKALKAEFIRQGNKSVLCLPLIVDGRLRGLFGFDATRRYTQWSDDMIGAMFACADLLGFALHGSRVDNNLGAAAGFPELIYLRDGSDLRGVPLEEIVAVRAKRNTSEVMLKNGETILADARSIKEWEVTLSSKQFMRVHRSAIVRVKAVQDLVRRPSGRWHVTLLTGEMQWNVSREMVDALRSRMTAGKQGRR